MAMLYLPPSLGHRDYYGLERSLAEINEDLSIIEEMGFDSCLLENEKDAPYLQEASPENIASLAIYTREVTSKANIPVGFNFLLNDPLTSLTVAKAAGAQYIRSDYFCDEMIRESDQRIMKVNPQAIIQHRKELQAEDISLLADVQVKHAKLLRPRPLEESILDTFEKGAEGAIISGQWTGKPPTVEELILAKKTAEQFSEKHQREAKVYIGSGLNADNAKTLLPLVDGAIVGTAILTDGRIDKRKSELLLKAL